MEPIEKWLSISGYEGRYEVSNFGRIKALERIEVMSWMQNKSRTWKEKILIPNVKDNEYLFVVLYDGTGRANWKHKYIHRLVADAFKKPLMKGDVVNHKDRNRQNNHEDNIEVLTQRENCLHSVSGRKKSSKFPGVHLEKATGWWKAMARHEGKKRYLGKFDNEESAYEAYKSFIEKISPNHVQYL
jgi:hypothetical protein